MLEGCTRKIDHQILLYDREVAGVAITFLVLGILGSAYLVGGLLRAPSIFTPLQGISGGRLVLILMVGGGGVIALSIYPLVVLYRKKRTEVDPDFIALLKGIPGPTREIRKFLKYSHSGFLEHYAFYRHLSQVSQHEKDQKQARRWQGFLELIDGERLEREDGKKTVTLHCLPKKSDGKSNEERLEREDGQKTVTLHCLPKKSDGKSNLAIEEVTGGERDFDEIEKAINEIHHDAFDSHTDKPPLVENGPKAFLKDGTRIFVARKSSDDQRKGEIVGVVYLQPDKDGKWLICNLGRRAHATGLAVAETLLKPLIERMGRTLYLQVYHYNTPAIRLYESLGFQIVHKVTHVKNEKGEIRALGYEAYYRMDYVGQRARGAAPVHASQRSPTFA